MKQQTQMCKCGELLVYLGVGIWWHFNTLSQGCAKAPQKGQDQ